MTATPIGGVRARVSAPVRGSMRSMGGEEGGEGAPRENVMEALWESFVGEGKRYNTLY